MMPKGVPTPEKPIDTTRGVFKLDGRNVLLLGEHIHEVIDRVRGKDGTKVVQISKLGRRASAHELAAAHRARREAGTDP